MAGAQERDAPCILWRVGGSRKSLFGPVAAAVAFVAATVGLILYVLLVLDQRFLVWVTNLPVLALHFGVIAFWCLFTVIVWWIAERTLDRETREEHKDAIQRLLLVVSSFFVFFLGFIVSQEWDNVDTVRSDVSSGAVAIDTAAYKAEALPQPQRGIFQEALANLGRSIDCEEIPAVRDLGEGSRRTETALRDAFLVIARFPPEIQRLSIFQDLLDEVGNVSDSRRQVLTGAASGLPVVVLFTIFFVGGLLVILFIVQLSQGRQSHLALTLGLVMLISVGTGLVLSLSRPFGGAAELDEDFNKATRQIYTECSQTPD